MTANWHNDFFSVPPTNVQHTSRPVVYSLRVCAFLVYSQTGHSPGHAAVHVAAKISSAKSRYGRTIHEGIPLQSALRLNNPPRAALMPCSRKISHTAMSSSRRASAEGTSFFHATPSTPCRRTHCAPRPLVCSSCRAFQRHSGVMPTYHRFGGLSFRQYR